MTTAREAAELGDLLWEEPEERVMTTKLRRFIVEVSVNTESFPDDPNDAADEFHNAIGLAPFPEWVSSIDFVEPGARDPE